MMALSQDSICDRPINAGAIQMAGELPMHVWEKVLTNLRPLDRGVALGASSELRKATLNVVNSWKMSARLCKAWTSFSTSAQLQRLYLTAQFPSLKTLSFIDDVAGIQLHSELLIEYLDIYGWKMPNLAVLEVLSLADRLRLPAVLKTLAHHLPNIRSLTIPVPESYGMDSTCNTEKALLEHLALLPNLQTLVLGHGSKTMANWPGRRHPATGCITACGMESLAALQQLTSLSVSNCLTRICNNALRSLGQLTNLTSIHFYNYCTFARLNPPHDFSPLSRLTSLRSLYLDMTPAEQQQLTTHQATGDIWATVNQLLTHLPPSLTTLHLHFPGEKLPLDHLQVQLPSVTSLSLPGAVITPAGLRVLAHSCPRVQELTVHSIANLEGLGSAPGTQLPLVQSLQVLASIQMCEFSVIFPGLKRMMLPFY